MLEQYGVSGSMRDNPPLWSFRDVPSPSSISISIDGKFAGVGSKSGVVLVNQNGRAVWKNSKARRINDISISSQTGKLSVASGQKVLYLINKKGEIVWHRELQGSAISTSISARGHVIAVGTDLGHLVVVDGKGKIMWEEHLSNSDFPVNTVNVSSDGQFILSGTDYSRLYLHDKKGEVLLSKETTGPVIKTCISSNGDYVGYLTGDGVFSFGVKSSRVLWEKSFSETPSWIDMCQTADFVTVGETGSKVTLFNKAGRKVWGFRPRNCPKGVMASGGGFVLVSGTQETLKYSLDKYLVRLQLHCQKRIEKATSENLDTTSARKYFDLASSDLKKANHLSFLTNIQLARRSAREARIIESEQTPSERRLERNEVESSLDTSSDSNEDELMSKLVQLAEMRESGILSEEEFIMAKSKLLKL